MTARRCRAGGPVGVLVAAVALVVAAGTAGAQDTPPPTEPPPVADATSTTAPATPGPVEPDDGGDTVTVPVGQVVRVAAVIGMAGVLGIVGGSVIGRLVSRRRVRRVLEDPVLVVPPVPADPPATHARFLGRTSRLIAGASPAQVAAVFRAAAVVLASGHLAPATVLATVGRGLSVPGVRREVAPLRTLVVTSAGSAGPAAAADALVSAVLALPDRPVDLVPLAGRWLTALADVATLAPLQGREHLQRLCVAMALVLEATPPEWALEELAAVCPVRWQHRVADLARPEVDRATRLAGLFADLRGLALEREEGLPVLHDPRAEVGP